MNEENKRKGSIPCEVCGENPATDIKGGSYNGERKMWMTCKECKSKIKDERCLKQ